MTIKRDHTLQTMCQFFRVCLVVGALGQELALHDSEFSPIHEGNLVPATGSNDDHHDRLAAPAVNTSAEKTQYDSSPSSLDEEEIREEDADDGSKNADDGSKNADEDTNKSILDAIYAWLGVLYSWYLSQKDPGIFEFSWARSSYAFFNLILQDSAAQGLELWKTYTEKRTLAESVKEEIARSLVENCNAGTTRWIYLGAREPRNQDREQLAETVTLNGDLAETLNRVSDTNLVTMLARGKKLAQTKNRRCRWISRKKHDAVAERLQDAIGSAFDAKVAMREEEIRRKIESDHDKNVVTLNARLLSKFDERLRSLGSGATRQQRHQFLNDPPLECYLPGRSLCNAMVCITFDMAYQNWFLHRLASWDPESDGLYLLGKETGWCLIPHLWLPGVYDNDSHGLNGLSGPPNNANGNSFFGLLPEFVTRTAAAIIITCLHYSSLFFRNLVQALYSSLIERVYMLPHHFLTTIPTMLIGQRMHGARTYGTAAELYGAAPGEGMSESGHNGNVNDANGPGDDDTVYFRWGLPDPSSKTVWPQVGHAKVWDQTRIWWGRLYSRDCRQLLRMSSYCLSQLLYIPFQVCMWCGCCVSTRCCVCTKQPRSQWICPKQFSHLCQFVRREYWRRYIKMIKGAMIFVPTNALFVHTMPVEAQFYMKFVTGLIFGSALNMYNHGVDLGGDGEVFVAAACKLSVGRLESK